MIDPAAIPKFISEDGSHIIFKTSNFNSVAIQLEPDAPPSGTEAIYDRTADEVTHVVSLLPGNVTPAAGQNSEYDGASADGSAIVFQIGSTLYERLNNSETFEVAAGNPTFAGISADGDRVLYLSGANLFAFDVKGEETTQITTSADVTPVNVSADGSHVYFASPSVLSGEANPRGDEAVEGKENLYLWDGSSTHFVATVTKRDIEGESSNGGKGGGSQLDGLGLWVTALNEGKSALDPSRTTPNGTTLLFDSRAKLTDYDSGGKAEVYRYDASGQELSCLSCSPTRAPAGSDASLESVSVESGGLASASAYAQIPNLSPDGRRAFFESSDALVAADTDGLQDVYEWESDGVGSCAVADGCLFPDLLRTQRQAQLPLRS